MKKNNPKLLNKWGFLILGVGFSLLYWLLESVRDVFIFEKGNFLQRIFSPDPLSFWMRLLIVMFLILFSIHAHSIKVKTTKYWKGKEKPGRVNGIIWAGLIFSCSYWIMEAVRDVIVFEKGNIFKLIFSPEPLGFWMRLLAVLIIVLFSVYAQTHINKRKLIEEELRKEREELEKIVAERTAELTESNRLLTEGIKERTKSEEEKRAIQEQLFQAQKMEAMGILAGGIAHDFNNLITAIQGIADTAMLEIEKNEPWYSEFNQIQELTKIAANVVRQILLFSRNHPIKMDSINLNDIIMDLVKMLHRWIGTDIELKTDLDPDIWLVQGDRTAIEQIVMNMALNARDAMPDGGNFIIKTENLVMDKIRIEDNQSNDLCECVCLSFMDTGIGMDKKILQHIFEPFYTNKIFGKGTGLGLSVVYGIVKNHNGWIKVTSDVNKGTTFKIYIPSIQEEGKEEISETVLIEELDGKNKRILVVEDEKRVLEFAVKGLNRSGYQAFPAATAEEAEDAFKKENGDFHLIFSDIDLPDKNGIDLVNELQSQKPDLKVLLSSGYPDYESRWPKINKMHFPLLVKPFALGELLYSVQEIMNSANA